MNKPEEQKILKKFKGEFHKIRKKGWISSNRFHDTGIGKTFEDFIGVIENNKSSVDYEDLIELKSARELSKAMVTIFTKSPEPRSVNSKIRETFGYFDKEHKDKKILHTTFSANKFNNSKGRFGFKLDINFKERKIFVRIKNLKENTLNNSIEAFYTLNKLKEIIEDKCKYIIFIEAKSKMENGQEFFKFEKAILMSGLTFDKFLKFLQKGVVKYDFRLGVYRSGKMKGKNHDHGSGFRVLKKDLSKVFKITKLD